MVNYKAVETYSEAIFELAKEQNILEQIEEDLLYVKDLLHELPEFRGFVEAPVLESKYKIPVLEKVLSEGIHTIALHFIFIMIERGRADCLEAAITKYVEKSREERGIQTATVWVARELTDERKARIKAELEAETGKEIILHVKTDPTIMAGIVIEIGDKRYDASVARRLKNLEMVLRSSNGNTTKIGVNESV